MVTYLAKYLDGPRAGELEQLKPEDLRAQRPGRGPESRLPDFIRVALLDLDAPVAVEPDEETLTREKLRDALKIRSGTYILDHIDEDSLDVADLDERTTILGYYRAGSELNHIASTDRPKPDAPGTEERP